MKLDSIFRSNMVFAAGKPIRICGEGQGQAQIRFASYKTTITSSDETWLVEFPAMEYGGPYQLEVSFENEHIIFDDIYVGEVYLFAGQSNMQFKLHESSTALDLYETNDKLRLFSTDRLEEGEYFNSSDGWVKSDKEQIGNWSAIAYLAGNEISKTKDIAVGVIACYQRASVIESWVPKNTFKKLGIQFPDDKKMHDHFAKEYSVWNKDGTLYSFALSQVIPFSLSAVIWYQGESDTSLDESLVYANELCELIRVWRKEFHDEELPFIIIQIADYIFRVTDEAWKNVQKAQLEVQTMLPHVTTVISADVCETDDIHPKSKDKVAKRVVEVLSR